MANTASLLLSLFAVSLFGCGIYHMAYKVDGSSLKITPKSHLKYGQLRYKTFLTNCVQFVSMALHVLAHFVRPLRGLRDLVFTSLAVPMGGIVCYSFWGVWFLLGRELIFPREMDAIFPNWLNHTVHTSIVPINLLLACMVHHKYYKNASLITLTYMLAYCAWLYYIKFQTGFFVYPYMDTFDEVTRLIYIGATAVFSYLLYKFGQWFTYAIHGKHVSEGARSSSTKRKQK